MTTKRSSTSDTGTITSPEEESEILHSQCIETVKNLFPDGADVGICKTSDVLKLTAIYREDRIAQRLHTPRLPRKTKVYSLNTLVKGAPFHDYHPKTGLIDLRRYLKLLVESFRSFKEENTAVDHAVREKWHEGINRLDAIAHRAWRDCPPHLLIELWDTTFLLHHAHNLLISVQDSFSRTERLVERGENVVDAALNIYGNQLVDGRKNVFNVLHRHRSRAPWHNDYMKLDERCFETFAETGGTLGARAKRELETTIALRDRLDDELIQGHGAINNATQKLKNFFGMATKKVQSAGPYEENANSFEYGLLDLMYQISFQLQNRTGCFKEMVGGIRTVLERSLKSANLLHRKALDVYHRIIQLGEEDKETYCTAEDRAFIEKWKKEHSKEVDAIDISKRYFRDMMSLFQALENHCR